MYRVGIHHGRVPPGGISPGRFSSGRPCVPFAPASQAVAARHSIPKVYESYQELLADPQIEVLDIAVPPDVQYEVIREAARHTDHLPRGTGTKAAGSRFRTSAKS